MQIRLANIEDFRQIWSIFRQIVEPGDTYTFDSTTNESEAQVLWMETPLRTFVCVDQDEIIGTYYLKRNQSGGGSHVCNCGYMVPESGRGKGVASAMCEHSQEVAKQMGFTAMQFNFVVKSNQSAIKLWQRLGFEIVGTLPNAFNHPTQGLTDAHVMFKDLSV